MKKQAREALSARCGHHAARIRKRVKRISLRDPKSRWGSCASTGALSFSWRLILTPPIVLDYVAAHECAHLRHMDHSREFWTLVDRMTPHRLEAQDWLRTHGASLHRVGLDAQRRAG